MRRLYLLRHAKSSWDDESIPDHERSLAPRGRRSADLMARHIQRSDVHPALVLCSSSLRTRQTLAAILPALGEELTVQIDRRLYGASDETILERLRAVSEDVPSVMVIGHNPGVQDLALSLARGGPALGAVQEGFAAGALATLELPVESWRAAAPGTADVVDFVTPRALA
jgi:phosphohistidine phosphatase